MQPPHQFAHPRNAVHDLALLALQRLEVERVGRLEHVLARKIVPHASRDRPALARPRTPMLALRHEAWRRREIERGRRHAALTAMGRNRFRTRLPPNFPTSPRAQRRALRRRDAPDRRLDLLGLSKRPWSDLSAIIG